MAATASRSAEPVPRETARLVEAAKGGDRAAFAELYVRYGRMVQGLALSRLPTGEADDVVQEVFLLAMQRLPALEDAEAFGGWVAAIARHRVADHLRHAQRTEPLPATLVAPGNASNQAEVLAVHAVLRTLPDAYRETLTLRLVMGMTGPEISACTGLTEGSVRVNLHRGMKILRQRLEGTIA